jgi:hypothetical protein
VLLTTQTGTYQHLSARTSDRGGPVRQALHGQTLVKDSLELQLGVQHCVTCELTRSEIAARRQHLHVVIEGFCKDGRGDELQY